MSFKVNVDIVIALNALKISSFRKQGLLRFRVALFQTHRLSTSLATVQKNALLEDTPCNPYNIYKKKSQPLLQSSVKMGGRMTSSCTQSIQQSVTQPNNFTSTPVQSFIDYDQDCYYSRICESRFQTQNHKIEQCCFFRTYIDVERMDEVEFKMKVELLFAQEGQKHFIEAGAYEAVIHKIHGISTYLPVLFDEFGGFIVNGTYQSTIMEYRFEASQQMPQFNTFTQYISAATQGLKKEQIKRFYQYYRKSLELQLFSIQERHSDLLRVLNIPANYGFVKMAPNQHLYCMINEFTSSLIIRPKSRQQLWSWQNAKEQLVDELNRDFLGLKAIIYQKWNEYILFLGEYMKAVTDHFRAIYEANVKQRLKNYIFSHHVQYNFDWTYSRYEDSGKVLLKQFQNGNSKQKEHELWTEAFPIESKNFFEAEGKNIKIFEEVYPVNNIKKNSIHRVPTAHSTRESKYDTHSYSSSITVQEQARKRPPLNQQLNAKLSHQPYPLINIQHKSFQQRMFHEKLIIQKTIREQKTNLGEQLRIISPKQQILQKFAEMGQHIIIFVHGYQASRQDFVLFKSCLQIKYRCRVFISSSNEGRTEQTIQNLGRRLAVELSNFFKNVQFKPKTRLSFVGHSMGGIIIRSALSEIRNLDPYLYTYMSFSSPHLGYLYEPSALVQAGLWLLNTWQKSQSLDQICMRDAQDPRKSFLYRLSETNSLKGFKNIVLMSSSQDEYVPYESARVEKNNLLLNQLGDSVNSNIIKQMVDNILGEVNCSYISRMNVVFNIEDNNFDSIIGRTAHVKYLSDQKFIKLFCSIFDKYLE